MSNEGYDSYDRIDVIQPEDNKGTRSREKTDKDRTIKLDSVLKTQYERAFGVDLSDVRIHIGPFSDELTRRAHANAVTIGSDIYFHSGAYAPDTEEGKNLLAHELQHFVQFKDDKRMVYQEDIAEIEEEAAITEMMMSGLNLHHVTKPYAGKDKEHSAEDDSGDDYVYNEAKEDIKEPPKSFKEFGTKRDKPLYRIYFTSTGKVYTLTQSQREKAIVHALQQFREYIDREASLLPEKEREQFIIKHLSFLSTLY
ncbi:MAG: DUF4157 domain-containing protein [Spirochaetales bacterium]|nr:DUF4157 domain-containing protein [Spirochaetales bacterium]